MRRCRWDFPDVIKFRVAAHTISEKAIRCRHQDYNPDRAQKLISSSMSRHLSTRNISSKSTHAFLSNLAHRQRDRQTNKHGQKHIPLPLSEVNYKIKLLKPSNSQQHNHKQLLGIRFKLSKWEAWNWRETHFHQVVFYDLYADECHSELNAQLCHATALTLDIHTHTSSLMHSCAMQPPWH